MARPDNANGARAKLREAAVIPVSTPLVRLYSEYMHGEYGDLDCDYVFVNLFGGRIGQPLCYPTVHRLAARISARTGIAFTVHMLRHTHATELIRRGVPIEVVARLLTHHSSTTTSQTYIHLDAADVREALVRAGGGTRPGAHDERLPWRCLRQAAPGAGSRPGRPPGRRVRRRPLERAASRRSRNPRAAGGPVRRHHPGLAARPGEAVVPVPAGHRVRVATISAGALALSRFSAFLAERHPGIADETGITRPVLEDYLSWLLAQGYSASTRALWLSVLRVFSDACHRHGWLPGLPHSAVIYAEELPYHHDQVARFIPEFVMAQLESPAALDQLPFTTTRNLVVVLIETGLRGGDACGLAFSPTLEDSAGWPCLRFEAVKVRAEQLIPLSAKAAAAIRSQQEHVLRHWPAGSPWLFPGITGNDDGAKAYSHRTFAQQLAHWQRVIDVRDQAPAGHRDRSPVPPHSRDPAHQQRRPPARRAKAARSRQPAHDRALRPRP